MYRLTSFASIFENKTNNAVSLKDWDEFLDLFKKLSETPGRKLKKGERGIGSPLISPAVYKKGTTRANKNVLHWAKWCALDIDEYEGSYMDILAKFKDYRCIVHSTASSTKDHPKFRVILPTTKDIQADDISKFWYSINKKFGCVTDEQTKDLSRMFYVPAKYPGAFNFIYEKDGDIIDYEQVMLEHGSDFSERKGSFYDNLPNEVRDKLLAHKTSGLSRSNHKWSGISDCPFVNQKQIDQYKQIAFTDGSGRYALIYKIMTTIACNAVKANYNITVSDIVALIVELDTQTSNIYSHRPLDVEAQRAITFALTVDK